jgi:hypothetical protein
MWLACLPISGLSTSSCNVADEKSEAKNIHQTPPTDRLWTCPGKRFACITRKPIVRHRRAQQWVKQNRCSACRAAVGATRVHRNTGPSRVMQSASRNSAQRSTVLTRWRASRSFDGGLRSILRSNNIETDEPKKESELREPPVYSVTAKLVADAPIVTPELTAILQAGREN